MKIISTLKMSVNKSLRTDRLELSRYVPEDEFLQSLHKIWTKQTNNIRAQANRLKIRLRNIFSRNHCDCCKRSQLLWIISRKMTWPLYEYGMSSRGNIFHVQGYVSVDVTLQDMLSH